VIFFSFIAPRTSCRYDPTHISSECADNDQFQVVEKSKHHVADFALTVRPPGDRWAIEKEAQFFKIDVTFAQDTITLLIVPSECTDLCEQSFKVVRHSGPAHSIMGNDT
jgi:hypothetical protein